MILVTALQQIGTVQFGLVTEIKTDVETLMKIKTMMEMELMIHLMIVILRIPLIIGALRRSQIMTQMDVKTLQKTMTMMLMGY